MNANGFHCEIQSFIGSGTWSILYQKGNFFRKAIGILAGFIKRWSKLFSIGKYDFVFIHRETAPMGLPLFSFVLIKVLHKKVIFDFDDAIWMENISSGNSIFSFLKSHSNCLRLMKWSWKNSCGNQYLREFASQYNPASFYIPTTIDTKHSHNRIKPPVSGIPTIGWTGTHSTIHNLNHILPVLKELHLETPFRFVFISDVAPDFQFETIEFVKWNKETEIADLLKMDIGLMPLVDNEWSKGKCGLKILQYMASGIVPVVSSVGVNPHIVQHSVNGFCCSTTEEWKQSLRKLLTDQALRSAMASKTRSRIEEEFSTDSQRLQFLRLFAS